MRFALILNLVALGSACYAAALGTVGELAVLPDVSTHDTRRAVAFIMPEDGMIESIAIYHQGDKGSMLLGIYLGDVTPTIRVAITSITAVSATEGWQTAPLLEPVWIPRGARIWLAWVFENNPGVRYETQSQGGVDSNDCWAAGMPRQFGSISEETGTHSVYANYSGSANLVINEVLLRNDMLADAAFLDEDRTKQGWIELYNPGDLPVSLDGYYLSNTRDPSRRWPLPNGTLGPKDYLLVWGSGKDRRDIGRALHASFNTIASENIFLIYSHAGIEGDIDTLEEIKVPIDNSYGRYPDGQNRWYFYTQPTPGYANTSENGKPFAIDPRHVSLTLGDPYQLAVIPREEVVTWDSDNPRVWVDPAGGLMAVEDALKEEARATITATAVDDGYMDSCEVTIVNWAANLSELKVVATPSADYVLGIEGDALFYVKERELYTSFDGMNTSEFIGMLPEYPIRSDLLVTPSGYFLECNKTTYRSHDLIDWDPVLTMNTGGLLHGLAYDWEEDTQTGYLYAVEYSNDPNNPHSLYRGIFTSDGDTHWKTVLEFLSDSEGTNDRSLLLSAARHIHTVAVDPYTGHVWIATGDMDVYARILYSDDRGESFSLMAIGSQAYRLLSVWFTERYVYWATDASKSQSVWRISRLRFDGTGVWPSLTPELASGMTKAGIRYCITANGTIGHFPKTVGDIYTETVPRPLDGENRVRPIDDPEYDYKEEVARLCNGSLWYHLWVKDGNGKPLVILGGSAEGAQRDYRGRVFGIKELPDGSVDVQELLSVGSVHPDVYDSSTRYCQLEPRAQDRDGYIYFTGRITNHRIYKTRLTWTDHP